MSSVLVLDPPMGVKYTNVLEPVSRMGILYRIFPVSSAVTRRIGPKEAIHSPSSTSLVTNSPSSPASSRLGLTSAASVCNLLLHAEVSLHGTSAAMLKSCKGHTCAGVCSDRVLSPAHARSHHVRAQTDHMFLLHGQVPSSHWPFSAEQAW